ncbi:hypothetical protein THASP1DRAFT_23732 [Thamnocephalis sphaerospora]|uniref:Zinc finger PHD-type domain-containing protein n=1 Tax=Thamnocephalis sphaerospora TaxID=78915 RepID=A0A4V1IWP1_9FUNG|nr:hypothetical protein THASP1DRAFT_23732 [Thamnocephalis sphaerospora]|eukprot:RKP08239.1 hypothetical protein THASP1DRAFT_23732 [Thamnocephalis sphaerospora]
MENLCAPVADRHVPLAVMHAQHQLQLQMHMAQQSPMMSHFNPQLLRPILPGMPIMPDPSSAAAAAAPAAAATPPNFSQTAAAQLIYQQHLLQQQSQFAIGLPPPHAQQAQMQPLAPQPQLVSAQLPSPPAQPQPHVVQPDAAAYGYPASIQALIQAQTQLQAHKNNLRNGDVFFSTAGDMAADIDGVLGHLRPVSPALSPPLSPTEFLTDDVPEVNTPLFDYETRETVEFPVPASPPAEAELAMEKKPSMAAETDTQAVAPVCAKPTFIPLASVNPVATAVTAGNDTKAVLQAFRRQLCAGVLPTPPEAARSGPLLDAAEAAHSDASVNESEAAAQRKRKTSPGVERNAAKNAFGTRKRRAHSSASADGHVAVLSRKKAKPAPIVIKEDVPPASPSPTPAASEDRELAPPRPTQRPTIFEQLTEASIDWCRYCGTTEGVNWRPGPWGKRTLCNKHGCDYKGYGFACKLPRLNLTAYQRESIHERERPVLQLFCTVCHSSDSWRGNVLVSCEGCPKAYHQRCFPGGLSDEAICAGTGAWHCTAGCAENVQKRRIIVELPRKRLPLMRSPKDEDASDADSVVSMRRGSSVSLSEDGGSPRARAFPTATPVAMRARSYSATSASSLAAMSSRRTARARRRPFYGELDADEEEMARNVARDDMDVVLGHLPRSSAPLTCRSLLTEQFRFANHSYHHELTAKHCVQDDDDDEEEEDEEEDVAAARVLVDEEDEEDVADGYTARRTRGVRTESDDEDEECVATYWS